MGSATQPPIDPALLRSIEDALSAGNYVTQLGSLELLDHDPQLRALERHSLLRATADGLRAEMYFYKGEHGYARSILHPYATDRKLRETLREQLSARSQLQIAHYHYSAGSYDRAGRYAQAIQHYAEKRNDYVGAGSAMLQLMRIARRQQRHGDVLSLSSAAIEAFTTAAMKSDQDALPLSWRIGSVHLVTGFTHWRAGHLPHAIASLQTARMLLESSKDPLAKANVLHTLGVIWRSRGFHDRAHVELEAAHNLYTDMSHALNQARVLTDRARLDIDACRWESAMEWLRRAANLSNRLSFPRQNAEVLLWRAWLHLYQESPFRDTQRAFDDINQALNLLDGDPSPGLRVELLIAKGQCLEGTSLELAQAQLETAVDEAADVMPKHRLNALLTLAEFLLNHRPTNLGYVSRLYEQANGLATAHSSGYLTVKATRVRERLQAARGSYEISFDQVKQRGLQSVKTDLEIWAIEQALAQGTQKSAALALGRNLAWLKKTTQRLKNRKLLPRAR